MPGVPQSLIRTLPDGPVMANVQERGPDADFTTHIEADWDGNPDNMLLCFRYKGRRIGSVNPAMADLLFCYAYVHPVEEYGERPQRAIIPAAFECQLSDFQEGRVLFSGRGIILVQVYGRPLMRYAAVAFYGKTHLPGIVMASNCIKAAIERVAKLDKSSQVVIAGGGPWKDGKPFAAELKQRLVDTPNARGVGHCTS
ncbi:hypothetical protein MMC18_001185 [Xylographa bjoerkii]|nr:hypothetical protein [Xylographa bjoerkii]